MTCPEDRLPRELYWSGFGFQVWCQMLTFILRAKSAALLVIDEPDIYLHSDLQRQLISILRELGPDIVLATHSTEIISEVETDVLLNINKRFRFGRRIKNTRQLQQVFSVLGSNLNPTLTQLAKTKRIVFVEGKDFQILSRFARKLGLHAVANRSHFAVIPVEGFNPQKVKDFSAGMELTLGAGLVKCVIFDRDYRSTAESREITRELKKFCWHAVIHDRKEIENFLLQPAAIARAIAARLSDRGIALPKELSNPGKVEAVMMALAEPMKNKVQAQLVAANQLYERKRQPALHDSNTSEDVMNEFDRAWGDFAGRMKVVPGKDMLSALNQYLQNEYNCAITPGAIGNAFLTSEVALELQQLLKKLDELRTVPTDDESDSSDGD